MADIFSVGNLYVIIMVQWKYIYVILKKNYRGKILNLCFIIKKKNNHT